MMMAEALLVGNGRRGRSEPAIACAATRWTIETTTCAPRRRDYLPRPVTLRSAASAGRRVAAVSSPELTRRWECPTFARCPHSATIALPKPLRTVIARSLGITIFVLRRSRPSSRASSSCSGLPRAQTLSRCDASRSGWSRGIQGSLGPAEKRTVVHLPRPCGLVESQGENSLYRLLCGNETSDQHSNDQASKEALFCFRGG